MAAIAYENDDTLLLIFGTDQPIGAADLGMLLRDLSSDYAETTGGRLVLWRYETGSSWIYLRDAIAVAGSMAGSVSNVFIAVQHMAKFVGLLRGQLAPAKDEAPSDAVEHVTRSAARIVKVAAENNASVSVRYTKNEKTGIEDFSLSINQQQVRKLHTAYSRRKSVKTDAKRSATTTKINAIGVQKITQRLIATDAMSGDLVETIVAALKSSGGDHLLPSLASSLDAAGRYDIAEVVRRHIGGSGAADLQLSRD